MDEKPVIEQGRLKDGRERGCEIRSLDDNELVNRIAGGTGQIHLRDAYAAELQRRTTARLIESVDRFNEQSSRQATVMIRLTVAIIALTVVLLLQGFGCLAA